MAKKNTSLRDFLKIKVSFFTGSLVLITAFIVAIGFIPSLKENQTTLEYIIQNFL